jgi:endonuclease G
MSLYLNQEEIYQLVDAITSGGLNNRDARDALLMNINRGLVSNLPERRSISDQVLSDLDELNNIERLAGGEVPLKIWLENAYHRLRRASRAEQEIFEKMLERVAEKADEDTAPAPAGGLERIIHKDDLLEYSWLRGALEVGASVARLTVPRYEGGRKVLTPFGEKPDITLGTGWLIGPRHVMTNHHVINARSESEGLASEQDLALQAKDTKVQFDYDHPGAEGTVSPVKGLAAWSRWNLEPALDFALLELAKPCPRKPLTLAPGAFDQLQTKTIAVNIIQHPGGEPKSIGIRNNLTAGITKFELRYFTDTMQGSSGSPVCNDRWEVVALHRAEYRLTKSVEFQGKKTAWANRGVPIGRILEDLQQREPGLLAKIGAAIV